ncbi:plant transposon protein [Nitzschia inconspicua]|uniref:Plant transposon protein n=1 Tax=Nitzschia inconspicua TaxID=303405 RepID=A0A9K3Q5C2_9STRA|nr:plant transposon protein [Nitzschia inconspicua]
MDPNILAVVVAAAGAGRLLAEELAASPNENRKRARRAGPRRNRRQFRPQEALYAIQRDYIGITGDLTTPLFGAEFKWMFRLSRTRFLLLMEDIAARNIPHFMRKTNISENQQTSLEAKLLLPLKCLAYGVPPHAFIDYFQMSRAFARVCCIEFDSAIKSIYMDEWLRLPTAEDLKAILKLHKTVHDVDGMVGSLDCSHTYWKNCPVAWQGSFQGKEKRPSIVLEAISDYHLFFWHVSYGYTGNLNDRTILSMSPLMDRLIDGSFHDLEEEAGVVPFKILQHEFKKTWITVDGIYPKYNRFVKGIKRPVTQQEKRYTQWQEAVRKDIERAFFGVLKGTWQFLDRPILLMDLKEISTRVVTCIILHNILVSDRVMGTCGVRYDPAYVVDEDEDVVVTQPQDLQTVQTANGGTAVRGASGIGYANAPPDAVALLTQADRFRDLKNTSDYERLHQALMERFA